jgi:hypothetical protein
MLAPDFARRRLSRPIPSDELAPDCAIDICTVVNRKKRSFPEEIKGGGSGETSFQTLRPKSVIVLISVTKWKLFS